MKRVVKNAVIGNGKRKIAIVCVAVVSLCVVALGCDKLRNLKIDEIKISNTLFNVSNITFSKCKKALKSNENASNVQVNGKSLYITHNDILLNCGFEEVNVTVLVNGNTIELNVEESPVNANCVCPVDISYSVGEFEKGTYLLIIKLHNQQIYSQTVVF